MIDPAIALALRLALAALFASAALHKLRDLASFEAALADYQLLPTAARRASAWLLVASEIAAVAALLAGSALGAGLAAALLAVYAGAVAANLARGRRHIDCGCAGPALRQSLSGWLVARNLVLCATSLGLLAPEATRPLHALDLFTAAAAAISAGLLYAASNRLLAEWPALARLARRPA